jgi:predicted AAA+ superfamily ATPase
MDKFDRFLDRADRLMDKLERALPKSATGRPPDWSSAHAFRWEMGRLVPVLHPHHVRLADLLVIEEQKKLVRQNTLQFVQGRPANNVLLTGSRGTGKSSLVKALLNEYSQDGLRLIEVGKLALADLPHIIALVTGRSERFIVYCDDLSFNADEPGYQALKAALDGSLVALSDNLLIYATSNRRHLMPESMQENLATKYVGDEIHPAESIEEKISLSERFGVWVSFYPFSQDEYLVIVAHWLRNFGLPGEMDEVARQAALQWAIQRGSRSGRVAWQFARDWAGRK